MVITKVPIWRLAMLHDRPLIVFQTHRMIYESNFKHLRRVQILLDGSSKSRMIDGIVQCVDSEATPAYK